MAVPSFIGRSTELQQIKDHWKKACKGQPQVVNLIADTGVGKTRLVQAFYESLSTELKQGAGVSNRSYWPGSLGTDRQRNVNPPRESFTAFDLKNDCIPWLWWGMYWTQDNGENDCALRRFHDSLDVHLSMLELQRNGLRNNLTAVSDTLKDEALDFVTGLIPGGSQALSVFDLAKKLHGHQKAQKEAQKGLASQDKKRNNALANSIIERLQVVFNSKQKGISQVPMVLFLDDIHFATDVSLDGFCLQFLDRLLRQAAQEQWPLLILATHWKGPWQAHRSGVSLEEGKPWRRIVLGIDGAQNDKIPDVHTLELSNMPRDDLHRIANAMLPGLDLEDRVKILARVGNVRWLVEVLIALRENTDNFLNNDRGSSLSAGGHRNLEWLLLSNGYLDVIRKRLRSDAMQDVRFVLGATAWHAHELVFLSPLACAFGEKLVEEKALADSSEPGELVMSVLLRAFDPSALLEGHGQVNQLPLLVRFPERGYLEIAKEMFEPNEHLLPDIRLALGQEIIAWMHEHDDQPPRWQQLEDSVEKKAFLEIAVAVLQELQPQLSEEQQEELAAIEKRLHKRLGKGKITEEELKEDLQEAKQELLEEPEGPLLAEASLWHAVAMAELTSILAQEGDGRANCLAFALTYHPQLTTALSAIQFWTCTILSSLWLDKADYRPKARSLIDNLIESQSALLATTETPERLFDMAILLKCLAELDEKVGRDDQARAGLQHALEITDRLLEEFGETYERQNLHDYIFNSLRYLKLDMKRAATAQELPSYQHNVETMERRLDDFGETPEGLQDLAFALERLAEQEEEVQNDQALACYQRSLKVRKRLLDEFGETPERLSELAFAYRSLAEVSGPFHMDQRRENLHRWFETVDRLLSKFGETPERLRDLAIAQMLITELHMMQDGHNVDRDRVGYQRTLEIIERLIFEFGETDERREFRIEILDSLACLDSEEERCNFEQERVRCQRKVEIMERQLADFGETPELLKNLANDLDNLESMDKRIGDIDQARAHLERKEEVSKRRVGIMERQLSELGDTLELLDELTQALNKLAKRSKEIGNFDQARAYYQRSLEIQHCLLVKYGETTVRLSDLNITLKCLADLNQATSNP